MYFAHITLLSSFNLISAPSTFDRTNLGITDITTHPIPSDAYRVYFQNNLITYIPANLFVNMTSFNIWIKLTSNQITNIADSAFSDVPYLTRIHLEYNQLSVIRELMFEGVSSLQRLWLSDNMIHTIQVEL